MTGEWKEWKPELKRGPNIWEFQRGYRASDAGRHENNDQFNAFQVFLHGKRNIAAVSEETGHSPDALGKWAKKYNWDKRAARYDSKEMALAMRDAIERKRQRDSSRSTARPTRTRPR